VAALDPASADSEHVVDLPLAAWRGLAASLCAVELALSDTREDGAEVLVLDDGGLVRPVTFLSVIYTASKSDNLLDLMQK
jgi:hypothetical protein